MCTLHGIGIDIVNVTTFKMIIEKRKNSFTRKVFTRSEQNYCESKFLKYHYYASIFAAKEAILKALGMGVFNGSLPMNRIQLFDLHRNAVHVKLAATNSISDLGYLENFSFLVSLSFSGDKAIATAMAKCK